MLQLLGSLPPKYRSKVEQLYYEHKDIMFYTALGIVKDKNVAEDIVQAAFIRIIKHIEKIMDLPCNETTGYIVNIVKNLSIDFLRRQQHQTISYESIEYLIDNGESVEDLAINNFELSLIKKTLKQMDEKYSLPLILKYSLDCSHTEIAELLDISKDNVKVRCYRGRKLLIEAMRKEAVHE